MAKRLLLLNVAFAMALIALACGFSNPAATPIPTATPLPPVPPGTPQLFIDIKNFQHQKIEAGATIKSNGEEIVIGEVVAGTVFTWKNFDVSQHTVTHFGEGGERQWDSLHLAPDISFRHRIMEPGIYKYYCKIHPNTMNTKITVTAKSS